MTGDIAITNTGTSADVEIQDDAVQGDDLDVDSGNFTVSGTQQVILDNDGGLQVNNPVDVSSTLNVDGTVDLASAGVPTAIRGTLQVTEQADFTGNVDADAGLDVDGGNFTVADGVTQTLINNNDINLGNENTDVIDLTGVTNINGGDFTVDAPRTVVNSSTINIGDSDTDALTIEADVTINGEVQGEDPIVLQGASDNLNTTTIRVTDPPRTTL